MNSLSVYNFALNINRISKTYQLGPMFEEYDYTTKFDDKQTGQQIGSVSGCLIRVSGSTLRETQSNLRYNRQRNMEIWYIY